MNNNEYYKKVKIIVNTTKSFINAFLIFLSGGSKKWLKS